MFPFPPDPPNYVMPRLAIMKSPLHLQHHVIRTRLLLRLNRTKQNKTKKHHSPCFSFPTIYNQNTILQINTKVTPPTTCIIHRQNDQNDSKINLQTRDSFKRLLPSETSDPNTTITRSTTNPECRHSRWQERARHGWSRRPGGLPFYQQEAQVSF